MNLLALNGDDRDQRYFGVEVPDGAKELRVRVNRPGIPEGAILLDDISGISRGLQEALTKIVQRDMGYIPRTRPTRDAKEAASLILSSLGSGSAVLDCRSLHNGGTAPAAAILAAATLVRGIDAYRATRQWPTYLPSEARIRLGAALGPFLYGDITVELSIGESQPVRCTIDQDIRNALSEPEQLEIDGFVPITGKIVEINERQYSLKLDTRPRVVTVDFAAEQFSDVDSMRWQRVALLAIPYDTKLSHFDGMKNLRVAGSEDIDGIHTSVEDVLAADDDAVKSVETGLALLLELPERWDSYHAKRIEPALVEYAGKFFRGVCGALLAHGIKPRPPFVAPIATGKIQFEWVNGLRELDLEFTRPQQFRYFASNSGSGAEVEGECGRWEAISLIRWIEIGELS